MSFTLTHPTDDDGLPIANLCAVCEEEFDDGDTIIRLTEYNHRLDGACWVSEVADPDEYCPEVHAGCVGDIE